MQSEMHLGPCLENQLITIDLMNKQVFWPIFVKIISENIEIKNKNRLELQKSFLEFILSLLEGENQKILDLLMVTIHYKLLEDCLFLAYTKLIFVYLNITVTEYSFHIDLLKISKSLTDIYKNNTKIYEEDNYVRILAIIFRIFHIYSNSNNEVMNYLEENFNLLENSINYKVINY